MKKLIAVVLSVIVLPGFAGCSGGDGGLLAATPSVQGVEQPHPEKTVVAQGSAGAVETISREEWLAPMWIGDGPAPTPLPVEREVTMEEVLDVHGTCLEEAGFPDERDEFGNHMTTIPEGQEQIYAVAFYQCNARYPLMPKYYQPYNEEQLRALYSHHTGELMQCLGERGWAPESPPSYEKFAADWRNGVSPRWHPYDNVPDLPNSKQRELERECPIEPDGFYDLATIP